LERADTLPCVPGRWIVVASWAQNALFFVTAIPFALGVDGMEPVAVVTAIVLFFAGLVVWGWSFAVAVVRSTQGDDLAVASIYLNVGGAPRNVRFHLFGSVALSVILAAATAASDKVGVLVPMLPLALVGLWATRYGTFPPRRSG
jgi:hypothetical protein